MAGGTKVKRIWDTSLKAAQLKAQVGNNSRWLRQAGDDKWGTMGSDGGGGLPTPEFHNHSENKITQPNRGDQLENQGKYW